MQKEVCVVLCLSNMDPWIIPSQVELKMTQNDLSVLGRTEGCVKMTDIQSPQSVTLCCCNQVSHTTQIILSTQVNASEKTSYD